MSTQPSTTDYVFSSRGSLVGAQMLFVAFGALVLVPLLTGLDPNVALFTAGVGTLIFQFVTKRMVPIFLASSFAFIAPIIHGVSAWGIPGTMCGLVAAGFFYVALSICIKTFGAGFLNKLLPPVVVGPVIMVIGLVLAPVAVHMAMGRTGDGSAWLVPQKTAMIVAGVALLVTVLTSILGKGWLRLIPILIGITAGYLAALILDATGVSASIQAGFDPGSLKNFTGPAMVSFQPLLDAPWFAMPQFVLPEWNLEAIIFIVPVAIAPAIEHFGDILAIGTVTGKDFIKNPGIHRTMLGDGIATAFASLLGGPPNTTYSEVTGAVTLTRMFNPGIMTWAAIFAITLAFIGKMGALLQTIPVPVMGGIMLLLFGAITVVGLNTLVKAGEDLTEARNLTIVALILVCGIGGMVLPFGAFTLGGIGLAGVIGVVLNLILPGKR
ncbi:putative uracil permease [Desulfosarcina cetonica]|uniref:uracil-xanthine permease family protein n=1 Tax=Desulfosarcina cetonica TaxID=90730 RepID=UPI0006CFD52A|nr:uracil-xanthine permease family protein [Desulfosarcina cetonica]VTR69517.1 putative uracil permease [Desulfosarcina cetonica]